jgi:predicted nucleic acid-binding protein
VKFIVDANLLSEATKPSPDEGALSWLRNNESEFAVTPVILGELEFWILLLPPGQKRKRLELWFKKIRDTVLSLDFDKSTATAWARLLATLKSKGLSMPVKDSLIAASAINHNLVIATRKTRDFQQTGIPLVNPFGK